MSIYRDLYANTMHDMIGQGDPEDYYYWVYNGMGLTPQLMIQMGFLTTAEWSEMGQNWQEIENDVNQSIECE